MVQLLPPKLPPTDDGREVYNSAYNSAWETVFNFIANLKRNTPKRLLNDARKLIHEAIYTVLLPEFALSADFSKETTGMQINVSELVRFDGPCRRFLSRKIAGAVIERSGHRSNALYYYQGWMASKDSEHHVLYAATRWIVCKKRQAKFEREKVPGNEDQAKTIEDQAKTNDAEAERMLKKYTLPDSILINLDYPSISKREIDNCIRQVIDRKKRPASSLDSENNIDLSVEVTAASRGVIGSLTYRGFPSKGWINFEADDGLCARVVLIDRTVTSDDVKSQRLDADTVIIDRWSLRIQWVDNEIVRFVINNEGNLGKAGVPLVTASD
jgi:hypothetical protein